MPACRAGVWLRVRTVVTQRQQHQQQHQHQLARTCQQARPGFQADFAALCVCLATTAGHALHRPAHQALLVHGRAAVAGHHQVQLCKGGEGGGSSWQVGDGRAAAGQAAVRCPANRLAQLAALIMLPQQTALGSRQCNPAHRAQRPPAGSSSGTRSAPLPRRLSPQRLRSRPPQAAQRPWRYAHDRDTGSWLRFPA